MNPILLALALTGPFRTLAPLDEGTRPVINSINDILEDHWLEMLPSKPLACDGPCAEVGALASVQYQCGDLKARVLQAQASWADVRQSAFSLAEVIEQSVEASRLPYQHLEEVMARTRAILTPQELNPTLRLQFTWRLQPAELLPGLPGGWTKSGAGFRVVRKTGQFLVGHPLDVATTTDGDAVVVQAAMNVAPVEYCAGDFAFRVEGAATFLRATTSGSLTVPLPISTNVALTVKTAGTSEQTVALPGDF